MNIYRTLNFTALVDVAKRVLKFLFILLLSTVVKSSKYDCQTLEIYWENLHLQNCKKIIYAVKSMSKLLTWWHLAAVSTRTPRVARLTSRIGCT